MQNVGPGQYRGESAKGEKDKDFADDRAAHGAAERVAYPFQVSHRFPFNYCIEGGAVAILIREMLASCLFLYQLGDAKSSIKQKGVMDKLQHRSAGSIPPFFSGDRE
jgi:hypothetical protein